MTGGLKEQNAFIVPYRRCISRALCPGSFWYIRILITSHKTSQDARLKQKLLTTRTPSHLLTFPRKVNTYLPTSTWMPWLLPSRRPQRQPRVLRQSPPSLSKLPPRQPPKWWHPLTMSTRGMNSWVLKRDDEPFYYEQKSHFGVFFLIGKHIFVVGNVAWFTFFSRIL